MSPQDGGHVFRFSLTGLIVFCLALMAGSAFITCKLQTVNRPEPVNALTVNPQGKTRKVSVGPWGEMITRDIELERPIEMFPPEMVNPPAETWTFNGMKPEAVKALLAKDGLTPAQVATLFAPGNFQEGASGTVLKPTPEFIFSLDTETRRQLGLGLFGRGVGVYLDFPYSFTSNTLKSIYEDSRLNPDDVTLLKQLVFPNQNVFLLTDYRSLLARIPSGKRRLSMARALSRMPGVLAGLTIRPDTDVDKIAYYWGHVPGSSLQ